MFHLPSVEQCICLLAMCIVQCCNLQPLSTRNLSEGIDEFGHKLMCILESLATFQHGICFSIHLNMLQIVACMKLNIVKQSDIMTK
jgi:hypothetical protein